MKSRDSTEKVLNTIMGKLESIDDRIDDLDKKWKEMNR